MTGSKRSGGEHLFYPKQRYLPQGEGLLVLHAFYRGMKEPWEDLCFRRSERGGFPPRIGSR